MVIFGATGDLTARKLLPAIYHLLEQGVIPDRFFIVGVARRPFSDQEFRNLIKENIIKLGKVEIKEEIWKKLEKNLYYQQGFFEEEEPYNKLVSQLKLFDKEIGACITRFFYLATPPQHYSPIIRNLDKAKLDEGCGQGSSHWTRILIEKPFGKDMETAKSLEAQLSDIFDESQIYRIDHYLAKETIQNILAFRFANRLFKPVWCSEHIDNIQVTLAEDGGIGNRGKLYDGLGVLKDIAQNHLMAILAYIAMEEPESFRAWDIRRERIKVLRAVRLIEPHEVINMVVRGQYGKGVLKGKDVPGFRQEKDIDPVSTTETYVAFKLFVDNGRWKGMPFYFRTGKRLKESAVVVDIQFKNPLSKLFSTLQFSKEAHANTLRIRIQPKESINFRFLAKVPGVLHKLVPVNMEFTYERSFAKSPGDSYEKILLDSMLGDQTLFATSKGFLTTWDFVTKIIRGWDELPPPEFPNYESGSWGPKEADELIRRDGRHWLLH